MTVELLDIIDTAFIRNESYLIYAAVALGSAFRNVEIDHEYLSNCRVYFGEKEGYNGECAMKVKPDQSGSPLIIVKLKGIDLGRQNLATAKVEIEVPVEVAN